MKKLVLFLGLSCWLSMAFAQSSWQTITLDELDLVLAEMAKSYQSKSYRFETRHQSFKGHQSVEPYDEMTGFFAKSGAKYHAKLLGSEVFQDQKHKVVIQHQLQQLQLHLADAPLVTDFSDLTGQFPAGYGEVSVRTIGQQREYRLRYQEGSKVAWMTFRLTADHFLSEMVMYLQESIAWEDTEGRVHHSQPKIRIAFENIETDYRPIAGEFDPSPYIVIRKKAIAAGEKSSAYELKDLRISKK